ncbi:MAG: glucose 1-dehydrogenase [Chloroflexota bacterium]|nr:glucose 1-dehydrogenase [Chloroflexota bacterium]
MTSLDLFSLTGKVALVTGGNGGLGLGMALGMAGAGANIAIAARNPDKTSDAIKQIENIGGQAISVPTDVTQESEIEAMVSQTLERLGHIDILVNNSGVTMRKEPEDLTGDDWDHVLNVNLRACFLASKTAYPYMRDQGSGKIINIGSMTSIFGGGGSGAPYSSSKGGIVQLSKSLAVAWAKDNIQSNAILPGWFTTELTAAIPERQRERYELISSRIPAGRWGEPDELAGVAVFLASSASDYVTGSVIAVDGGYSSF